MATIRIGDIGTTSIYTLVGDQLTMTQTGGCRDALIENGCKVSEEMADREIESAVYESWSDGYDGSPEANGLNVTVTRS